MAKANPVRTEQRQAQPRIHSRPLTRGQQGSQRALTRRDESTPALWADSPFALVRRFSADMDRFFGDVFADFGMGQRWPASAIGRGPQSSQADWSPAIEVVERDDELVVCVDLPGLSAEDINVEVTEDMLTISGERTEPEEGYGRSERRYGRFSRSIPLPEGVDAEDAQASLQNGVLEVAMPAPEREQRGRRIEIQEGASAGAQPSGEQATTAP